MRGVLRESIQPVTNNHAPLQIEHYDGAISAANRFIPSANEMLG